MICIFNTLDHDITGQSEFNHSFEHVIRMNLDNNNNKEQIFFIVEELKGFFLAKRVYVYLDF